MDTLLVIHSHNRNLVVLVLVVALAKLLWNVLRSLPFGRSELLLLRLNAALLTVQFLLGIALFVTVGSTASWDMSVLRHQFEHAFTMILALGCAHMAPTVRKREESVRNKRALILVLLSLVLVLVGVAQLRGWAFWMGGAQ